MLVYSQWPPQPESKKNSLAAVPSLLFGLVSLDRFPKDRYSCQDQILVFYQAKAWLFVKEDIFRGCHKFKSKKTLSLRHLVLYLVAINFKEINLCSFIYKAVLIKI